MVMRPELARTDPSKQRCAAPARDTARAGSIRSKHYRSLG